MIITDFTYLDNWLRNHSNGPTSELVRLMLLEMLLPHIPTSGFGSSPGHFYPAQWASIVI